MRLLPCPRSFFTFGNFPTLRLFTRHEKSCGPQPFRIKLFAGSTNRDILIDNFGHLILCVFICDVGSPLASVIIILCFYTHLKIVPFLTLVHKTRCPQPLFVWHLYTKHDVHHSLFDTCTQTTMSTTLYTAAIPCNPHVLPFSNFDVMSLSSKKYRSICCPFCYCFYKVVVSVGGRHHHHTCCVVAHVICVPKETSRLRI
jgi:hypothetical protein